MNLLVQLLVKLSFKMVFGVISILIKFLFSLFRKSNKINAKLLKIKDGDTFSFELENGEEINLRLFGIDTPEKFNSNKLDRDLEKNNGVISKLFGMGISKEEMIEAGNLATDFAKKLLTENSVYKLEVLDKDKYDRFVGIVYFNNNATQINVSSSNYNEEIIKQGYAKAYTSYINDDLLKFKYSYHNFISRFKNNGLWKTNRKIMINL